jgi:hypothetical protein
MAITKGIQALFIVVIGLLASITPASGQMTIKGTVSVRDGLLSWEHQLKLEYKKRRSSPWHGEGYAECSLASDIAGLVVCFFDTQEYMNRVFLRASFFDEGLFGIPPGKLLPSSDEQLQRYFYQVHGHALTIDKLRRFRKVAKARCLQDKTYCLSKFELKALDEIKRSFAGGEIHALVAFYRFGSRSFGTWASHELLQAQYFLSRKYVDAISDFWRNKVSLTDQEKIVKELGAVYSTGDLSVLQNKFQAYILQSYLPAEATDKDMLVGFKTVYRTDLEKFLATRGVSPLRPRFGISERQFYSIIDQILAIYKPAIKTRLGDSINLYADWNNYDLGVWSSRAFRSISIASGLARSEFMTPDAFALSVCHEVGHLLGGAPRSSSPGELDPSAVEGQADYWAGLQCIKKYFESDSSDSSKGVPIDGYDWTICKIRYSSSNDRLVCLRGLVAAHDLIDVIASANFANGSNEIYDLATPDPKIVEKTNEGYPSNQCRLETIAAGLLCHQPVGVETSDTDPRVGTCNFSGSFLSGSRPACWYSASKL